MIVITAYKLTIEILKNYGKKKKVLAVNSTILYIPLSSIPLHIG